MPTPAGVPFVTISPGTSVLSERKGGTCRVEASDAGLEERKHAGCPARRGYIRASQCLYARKMRRAKVYQRLMQLGPNALLAIDLEDI